MSDDDSPSPPPRAQLLATEHWSLLASRSSTQSEVLVRINMFLTLVSAGLVSLALVGQATRFSDMFGVFAIVVLAFVCLVGGLTQVRVFNVALEDLMYVLAMNRLRAAYVELDPGVEPFLAASMHDDRRGSERTYYFFQNRSVFSHIAGSSMVFMASVNSALVGLLVAAICGALGLPIPVTVALGVAAGLTNLALAMWRGSKRYAEVWGAWRSLSPTPGESR